MLTPGTSLGRYRILEPLGAGGMGEVYRAHDTGLAREVAVKVLPVEVASDPERLARFRQEARFLARLSHPNILEVFDVGEEDGVTFVVTELLEGMTLRERLDRGPLPWPRAVEIAADLAEALGAAHAAGVVHRDLKPANVFLTRGGRIKVLDFGLAQLAPAAFADAKTESLPALTRAGTVVGTPGYMSPEQLRGEAVDGRSDNFALGCVLWEMLTGRSPFRRKTVTETIAAILSEDPPPLELKDPEVPAGLSTVLGRCLAKDPAARFQSANDLAFVLRQLPGWESPPARSGERPASRRWALPVLAALLLALLATLSLWRPWSNAPPVTQPLTPDATQRHRILVQPFPNRTGDTKLDSLGGLIAASVARGPFPLPGYSVEPADDPAAMTAGTRLVISGTIEAESDGIRVQAQLTDPVRDEVVLVCDPVHAPLTDPMAAVEPVRQRVLGAAAIRLTSGLEDVAMTPPTLDAYVEFVRGTELFGSDAARSERHLRRALLLSPDFFLAASYLYFLHEGTGHCVQAEKVLQRVRTSMSQLTPTERIILAWMEADHQRRWAQSLEALRTLTTLVPNSSTINHARGDGALLVNRPREAAAVLKRAVALRWRDPRSSTRWWPIHELSIAYHMAGEYEKALHTAEDGGVSFPGVMQLYSDRAAALAALGRNDELGALIRHMLTLRPEAGTAGMVLRITALELGAHGHPREALEMARRAVTWYRSRPPEEAPRLRPWLARALMLAGKNREALSTAREVLEAAPEDPGALGTVGVLAARTGDRPLAEAMDRRLATLESDCGPQDATFERARIAAQLGTSRRALDLLREAFAQGYAFNIGIHRDPALEGLRGDPEFQELLRPRG